MASNEEDISKIQSDVLTPKDEIQPENPEQEPMLKKPAVAKKPKKKKPVAAKRQASSQSSDGVDVKPKAAPRTRKVEKKLDEEKQEIELREIENQPISEKPVWSIEPLPDRNQPTFSSQISRQSAADFNNTGDESQVQTFNFQQPTMAEYDEKQPSPTGFYGWLGFGCSVFALACLCISFASPYWMQTYPMSFNTFRNMGLWELCMHDYMHHKDDSQDIYNGCWWVFNRDEKYWKLREWVLPPWFITCQVLVTMCLLCSMATVGMIAMIFLHFCPVMNHEYHQSYAMFAASGLCFFNTILTVIVGIMYGLLCGDRQWMPRPDLNFISWGYGFMIIQGIIATAAGVFFFLEAQGAFNELDRRDQEYTKAVLDLEVSAFAPAGTGSFGQPSFDAASAGYSDQAPYNQSQSYASQPSYDTQQSYDPNVQYSGYNTGGGYNPQGYASKA